MENILLNCLCTLIASIGFGIIFNIRGKNLIFASIGGVLGLTVYLILQALTPDDIIRCFIATVVVTLYSQRMAKIRKSPAIVFLVVALIPLVPGYSIYKVMENLLLSKMEEFTTTGIYTFKVVLALSTGVLVSSKVIYRGISFPAKQNHCDDTSK